MREKHNKSVTLLELLLAIVLLSIIVLGLTSIDFFSRHNVVNADVRARLQNKTYLALEHIRKNISSTIGNEFTLGQNQVVDIIDNNPNEAERLKVFVDYNNNGVRDSGDYWRAYRVFYNAGNPSDRYQLLYCARCQNKNCNACDPPTFDWVPVISNLITFIPRKPVVGGGNLTLNENYVDVVITTCLHPEYNFDANPDCGTADNPQTTMRTRILLPAVSSR